MGDGLDNESGDNIDGDNNDDGSENGSGDSSDIESDENSDMSDMADTFDSGGEGDAESEDDDDDIGTGLGAVMSSILKTQKKTGVILSKAKKDYEVRQKERGSDDDEFEVVEEGGNIKKVKKDIKNKEPATSTRIETEKEIMLRRKEWENMNRMWPDVQADREKERKLRILATQGVVQLLGAIDKHAKSVNKKLSEARGELQRDKVLETTGKEAFMEVLRQEGEKVNKSNSQTSEIKTEMKEEPDERISLLPEAKKPKWGVLADNFYKEPTLDGWDKESDEE